VLYGVHRDSEEDWLSENETKLASVTSKLTTNWCRVKYVTRYMCMCVVERGVGWGDINDCNSSVRLGVGGCSREPTCSILHWPNVALKIPFFRGGVISSVSCGFSISTSVINVEIFSVRGGSFRPTDTDNCGVFKSAFRLPKLPSCWMGQNTNCNPKKTIALFVHETVQYNQTFWNLWWRSDSLVLFPAQRKLSLGLRNPSRKWIKPTQIDSFCRTANRFNNDTGSSI
jgi:hypothetical protein